MISILGWVVRVDMTTFGRQIRRARERLRMSQEELAALVGKDQRSVSEYESGKRRLSVTDLPAFAQSLEVPLVYFFEDTETNEQLDQAILEYFHQLPTPEMKHAAVEIVRILLQTAP